MIYKFFKNTGIQYFGDKESRYTKFLDPDADDQNPFVSEQEKKFISFTFRLFINEWLPLSIDNGRYLIRFFYNGKRIIYAIDTNIRGLDHHRNSLTENDITTTLKINPAFIEKYNSLNPDEDIFQSAYGEKWVNSILRRRTKDKSFTKRYSKLDQYDVQQAYRIFIVQLAKISSGSLFPEIKILADDSRAAFAKEANVYIDLGNSRTIGLIVEKDLDTKKYKIDDAAPLKLINYSKLMEEGINYFDTYGTRSSHNDFDYLIGSNLKFKQNMFAKYPQDNSFILPSMVVVGSEADDLKESVQQTKYTGISGPKRYLWDDDPVPEYWTFHGESASDDDIISGSFLEHLSVEDTDAILDGNSPQVTPTSKPLYPRYPKRTMMVFEMAEIIYQAFCQINSLHYRKRVGNENIRRDLKKIIMSFPTAMSKWERERLIKQTEKAAIILRKMGAIPYDIDVDLGSDEASCSQVAFVYGEASRFPGDGVKFFNIITGCRSDSRLIIASLDIGGGTTDLMIGQYERQSKHAANPNLKQKIIYSDGVNIAGDDILKHLINTFVIESIREAVNSQGNEDRFPEYFGDSASSSDRQVRVEAMNAVLVPIAEFYMHLMVNHKEINSRDLENVITLKDLNEKFLIPYKLKEIKPPGEEGYFIKNGIIDKSAYTDLPINNLIPSVDNLEKEVLRAYGEVLIKYAWIMSNYRPNYIILAGRTSSLPVISRILKEYITIPPSNIISLKDYFIGSWHPFSKNGIVNDPKTSVVVGNAITDLSMDKEMKDVNISTDGDHSDYTLNFIGVNQAGNRLSDDQIIYQSGEMIEDKQYLMNELNVIFRNMDDANMPCNLMYTLKLKEGIMTDEDPIGVRFEFVESEKGLKISSVSGDVINRKDNQKREATNDDVILKQKTLYDSEYWLDNGKFGVID